ncbi:MAG: molybdopterin-dependent oxidoreductase [Halioglobus sp.]|nr:molybdopterin-dependent oxidoreductase [Halioglobus sp.]
MPQTVQSKTFCRICEAQCGLVVSTQDDRVVDIKPNPDHVASKGYACIKGLRMGEFAHSPDRLQTPLKKVDGEFVPIGWKQALDEIGSRLRAIHAQHGGSAIAAYMGNPIAFSIWPTTVMTLLLKAFGADKLFTPGTQDCANKFAGGERLFGGPNEQVFPDVDHTQLLIVIGSNPVISKMSFLSLPHPMARLQAIEERGGRVYWVNPRRTESAKRFGEHVPIRPDTDVFFLLGFLHEVIARDGVDHDRVARYMNGYEALAQVAQPWPPERVEEVTRIPAATLREMVAAYLAADGAALYCSTGVNQGSFALLAYWLQEAINAISGNLDRRGGVLAGRGVVPRPPVSEDRPTSRIGAIPYVNSTIPAGIMADEILTPGPGKVRAMFNMSGNPLLTCAGSDRLAQAFDDLELFVCLDIVRNETAEYADYILPGLHSLERADVPFYFFTVMGLMPTRSFTYTDPVIPAPGECRDEGLILRQLCRSAGRPIGGSRLLQWASNLAELLGAIPWLGQRSSADRLFLSLLARSGRLGGLRRLRGQPDGVLLEPNRPGDYLGKRVNTASGKVELAPPDLVERAALLPQAFERERQRADALKLIQKRERYTHNTWAHNVDVFVQGERHTNYLYIHPADADARGLGDGDTARVQCGDKFIDIPVRRDEDMMPGSVAVPHGWGHSSAGGLSVASQTTGVNVNRIIPDGPGSIEPGSGMSHMNGVAVEVTAVARVAGADSALAAHE